VIALTEAFIIRNPNAVKHFTANCIQHYPTISNGPAAIEDLIPRLPKDFSYQPGMAVAEGDLVMVHGRYVRCGPKPVTVVDIFRIEGRKVAEHRDVETAPVRTLTTVLSGTPSR
jgi:predicted SnoaL-like aldol condensation-catalyzing enzyme